MTLHDGKIGNAYQVQSIDIDISIKRRLEAIGLIEHTRVVILNEKRNGSMIIRVRGTRGQLEEQLQRELQ